MSHKHEWKLTSTVREAGGMGTSWEEWAYLLCERCAKVIKRKVTVADA